MDGVGGANYHLNTEHYSMIAETHKAIAFILELAHNQIPAEIRDLVLKVGLTSNNTGSPYFPVPFKETEAISSLKAVESAAAAAIADIRYGKQSRRIDLDLERASIFLFSTYVVTLGGYAKQDKESQKFLKNTDFLEAQSILYRRFAANLYETKIPGEYYHIHGSLEATSTLNMIGLEGHRADVIDYHDCIKLIEDHVKRYTVEELETMNSARKQAGVAVLKWEAFKSTKHGKRMLEEPPWSVESIETTSPPATFLPRLVAGSEPQVLAGIKVLELCRIIAGPAIGRGLAEYGADVLKITSPSLSDVPFFQVDGNLGKHTADLDLHNPADRKTFESLLLTADVILDGFRPGSLERLGYGPYQVLDLIKERKRGIVYVGEDCFGHYGEWASRPGWQQIADCVTGIAWTHGRYMGLDEPVVPPFPMSDYGTGCMGTIAALTGLYKRAKFGGSYHGKCSIVQYDIYLTQLGLYDDAVLEKLRQTHDEDFFKLRHHDSVNEVGRRALKSMRRAHPELFEQRFFHESWSRGFNTVLRYVSPVAKIEGTRNGFSRSSRPNGFDEATWVDWEVDEAMVKA